MSVFETNLQLWAHFNPKQAILLQFRDPIQVQGLYESNPQGEAANWFKHLDLHNTAVLFIFGVGLGYYYEALKHWLKGDERRRVVFLENNLDVLSAFFHTERATDLLQNHQVQLLYFVDLEDTETVFEVIYWNFAMMRSVVSALKSYEKDQNELYEKLRHKISYDFAVKNALIDEYVRYGGPFFFNFYKNMLELPNSYLGNRMFGAFRNVPAIICGAGPSLAKSFPYLPQLMDKALIFAGGSALNALNAVNIQPHICAGIDPNPAQYIRLTSNKAFEIPFFYRNRMHHDAFLAIRGPKLYVTGSGGYDVAEYFEERLKIEHEFMDEGHNVINFCLQMAMQLGCNPILFVGMDLGYTDMQTYAPGIEENTQFDPESFGDVDDLDSKPLLLKDIHGKPLYTLWKWVSEAEWMGDFAKEHPELTLLNATDGGLGFPGVPNVTLKKALDEHLQRDFPIAERLHAAIQESVLSKVTLAKVKKLMIALRESLARSAMHFEALLEDAEAQVALIEKHKQITNLQSGRVALIETELSEEVGYQYVLEIFNEVLARLYSRDFSEERHSEEWRKQLTKLKINLKIFAFLRDLAKANAGIIDIALAEKKQRRLPKAPVTSPNINAPIYPTLDLVHLPDNPKQGERLSSGHVVHLVKKYGQLPEEAYLLKNKLQDGEHRLYYPNRSLKASYFYKEGKLHGPANFYSSKGNRLACCFFNEGTRQGEEKWFYPNGALYARFEGNNKEYFYPNGANKTP